MQKTSLTRGGTRPSGSLLAFLLAVAVLCAAPAGAQTYSDWSTAVNIGPPVSRPDTWDVCPFISKSGLELYFRRWVDGRRYDIFVSYRDTVDDPWGEPISLPINTEYGEICSYVSIDGHWLYFVSNRPGGCGGTDIWVSHRKNKRDDMGWETPKNLGCHVNSPAAENGPVIFEDEATGQTFLYFNSDRPGGLGAQDIYVSVLLDKETAMAPVPVTELNTTSNDAHLFVRRKDGLEAILFSNRPGTLGGSDLWVTTRPTTLSLWSTPVNLGPQVNSSAPEGRPSISWDGTSLFFWTTREGTEDIYEARRTKLPETPKGPPAK